jgi:hypothetical protein
VYHDLNRKIVHGNILQHKKSTFEFPLREIDSLSPIIHAEEKRGKRMEMLPIRIDPSAEFHAGAFYVPVKKQTDMYVVVVYRGHGVRVGGIYNQMSLAVQHQQILNSSMRKRRYQSQIHFCEKITSMEDLRKHLSLSDDIPIYQLICVFEFHILSSLVPNI